MSMQNMQVMETGRARGAGELPQSITGAGRGQEGEGEGRGEGKGGEGCQWVLHPAIQIVKAGADALLQLQGVCFQGSHSHMQGSFKRSELIWQSHVDMCSTLSPAVQLPLAATTPSEVAQAVLQDTPG